MSMLLFWQLCAFGKCGFQCCSVLVGSCKQVPTGRESSSGSHLHLHGVGLLGPALFIRPASP